MPKEAWKNYKKRRTPFCHFGEKKIREIIYEKEREDVR